MSAESNIVRPASRQISTSRVASATSLAPHALKNSLPQPKVPVPRLNAGTLKPEPPSCLYSIDRFPFRHWRRVMNYIVSSHAHRVSGPLHSRQADRYALDSADPA